MDADLDAGAGWDDDDEEWRGTEEERKRKVDAYMDEVVNKLGFSGIVSGFSLRTNRVHMPMLQTSHMPTRFHYTSVTPENYGLTPAEILLATDAELNSYVGLKKLAPYRIDKGGCACLVVSIGISSTLTALGGKGKKNWDPKRVQRLKEFHESLHSRVASHYEGSWSLGGGTNVKSKATEAQEEKKKRKGKKERAKLKAMQGENHEEGVDGDNDDVRLEVVGESQKRIRDPEMSSHSHTSLPGEAERDAEDGVPKKKRRRRHKKVSSGGGGTNPVAVS